MKLLHLLSQRPDSTGSGIYLQGILKESAQAGHRNYVIAGANREDNVSLPSLSCVSQSLVLFETAQLDFSIPGMSDIMPYRSSRFGDLSEKQLHLYESVFLQEISKHIRIFSPDVIHTHHLWLLSALVKKHFPRLPVVTNCHGSDLRQFHQCKNLQSRILRGCKKLDRIFALTSHQKEEIKRIYEIPPENIEVTGAGFNNKIFHNKAEKIIHPLQFVYCGKLSRAKGVPYLLKAMQHLTKEKWHLHLVGGGTRPDKDECLALAQNLGKSVTIHGSVNQDTLASLLQKSHFFILPSLYEGLPLVILEALACGCKVIATDLPGCREIYHRVAPDLISLVKTPLLSDIDHLSKKNENIFIEDIRKALMQAIKLFEENPDFDKGIVERNVAQFKWKKVFSKIEKIYNQLI